MSLSAPKSKNFVLPPPPADQIFAVKAWSQPVVLPSYLPGTPDPNPMFLDRRVYQGSSGRVYPLPFIDRIGTNAVPHEWQAIHLENEFLRIMILPEIGGRIHVGYDKVTGYDFFYRQNVIKPALVGLAGPWISGGVEFNWPQHHRPATFMPVETEIERQPDGSVTVWCSDHDPMQRMKGMHGVCLHPGRSLLEVRARLYNRTPRTQTFLWWANVATRVHERYQSFFPTDVRFVADHAKRAVTSYPQSDGAYYGIDYGERAHSGVPPEERPSHFVPDGSYPANHLGWYANIPVPTSYMITGTEQDFFGGYDHQADAGLVHVANHHIAPGKKQWTWGNHDFGYAWDRNLTDSDGPYIELMAGVYTDNQPDFSYLGPWETKTFTQTWYPIHRIGVPQAANLDAALHLSVREGVARVGLYVTRDLGKLTVRLLSANRDLHVWSVESSVQGPFQAEYALPPQVLGDSLTLHVAGLDGAEVIEYNLNSVATASAPVTAKEPLPPAEIASLEELYLCGVHLDQYRHATRRPELYWLEALRRDPDESRCRTAMALWHLHRGEPDDAAANCVAAARRMTNLNPNPRDGEPFYVLGLVRRAQGLVKDAYDAFYKATWSAAWRGPAYHALAELDMTASRWHVALDHLEHALRADSDNLLARAWQVLVLRRLGRNADAEALLVALNKLDPLDITARRLSASELRGSEPANGQQRLDLIFDLLRAGLHEQARTLIEHASPDAHDGTSPILLLLGAMQASDQATARAYWDKLESADLAYCFPNRIEEYLLLKQVTQQRPECAPAWALLGTFLYDRRRHEEAIAAWETSLRCGLANATIHRNLGIAYYNVRRDGEAARRAFTQAVQLTPKDARIVYERDQLAKRLGTAPAERLAVLAAHPKLVAQRDDLSIEVATLLNQLGRPNEALELLLSRRFQPWEGGEGLVLSQYVRAHLLLGGDALQREDANDAMRHFEAAMRPPETLSEAQHLLANRSHVYYSAGAAEEELGHHSAAVAWWRRAVRQKGDFREMAVQAVSESTYWTALSWRRLGSEAECNRLLQSMQRQADLLQNEEPKIDYFATSLPAMLLFEQDLGYDSKINANFLRAQALAGQGHTEQAMHALDDVLKSNGNHNGAADLRRVLAQTHPAERAL